jgi:hypothetical protein
VNDLDRILALTTAIEDRVADGDWSGAAALDVERQALLVRVCTAPGLVVDSGTRELLEQLLARNNATIARVRSARQELDQEVRRFAAAPVAMASYGRNGAPSLPLSSEAPGGEFPGKVTENVP